MNKQQMYEYLDQKKPVITKLSDCIWEYAETAFEEFQSADLLKKALQENGFSVQEKVGNIETAFCGTYGSGGPVIGILAEYDALSGLSQKAHCAEQQALTPGGNGHGCGHNLFAGGSVGAALAVKTYLEENRLAGTVKLFGCPAEEGGSGKAFMAREGVFDGLDAALAWHPMGVNGIFDMSSLANYQVMYRFKGKSAHAAASPYLGRSALDAVELMNVGANFLREHIVPQARVHYAIHDAGGFSPNVVQSTASVLYLIRAPKIPQVEEIYQRVNQIAQGAALMTGTEVEIEFVKACADLVPNKSLAAVLYRNFEEQKLPEYTEEELAFAGKIAKTAPLSEARAQDLLDLYAAHLLQRESRELLQKLQERDICDILLPFSEDGPNVVLPGSSDVGDVSWNVPTSQIVTACYAIGTPEHSWQLVSQDKTSIGHKGMMLAAKVLAGAAVDLLEQPELVEKARREFKERMNGQKYVCAIPKEVLPKAISKL
ncbi:M20 family metallopeptidase [Faecalispora anaeroviscerum]|uniref:M20 family metallopeptidase n=1 Tax=Faecalispora anaeroviscerum TaxID=2991836 RepID=UPI0024B99BE0|nr:M20 family metallopeptidase [Faecalispora anaeroviscerum]